MVGCGLSFGARMMSRQERRHRLWRDYRFALACSLVLPCYFEGLNLGVPCSARRSCRADHWVVDVADGADANSVAVLARGWVRDRYAYCQRPSAAAGAGVSVVSGLALEHVGYFEDWWNGRH